MRKFDTRIQYLRYKVLRETARLAWNDTLLQNVMDIPKIISPGDKPSMHCCIYKERAVLSERVKMAMGGDKDNPNIVEVLEIACDECPVSGYVVTQTCRGCLAHRCVDACKFGAITIDEHQKAHIDQSKCKECGMCAKVCPYGAIANYKRPCQQACKIGAISMKDDNHAAKIDNNKCISCGACVYQCPFGAINDKSYILDVINTIRYSKSNSNYNTYALVAPAIASQFSYAKLGQVISGIKALGFGNVLEVALGADMVALEETKEFRERNGEVMTSSCCPAFVAYVEKFFPDQIDKVSNTLSPMAKLGQYIKAKDPTAKIVFIGPCIAKKMEVIREEVAPYIDSVLTFEELQALFDSRDLEISSLEEETIDNASYFGRIFAHSGGLTAAVEQGIKEHGYDGIEFKPVACDGIEECKTALLMLKRGKLEGNFIEGMACIGGCVGGNGNLTHMAKARMDVEKYGKQSTKESMQVASSEAEDLIDI